MTLRPYGPMARWPDDHVALWSYDSVALLPCGPYDPTTVCPCGLVTVWPWGPMALCPYDPTTLWFATLWADGIVAL